MITDYQAKYYAYELTKRSPSDSLEKLTGAVASARFALNSHQVNADFFAFAFSQLVTSIDHTTKEKALIKALMVAFDKAKDLGAKAMVVVDFLNRKNEADTRVYELVSEKFQAFYAVFGANDEVLGAIGWGVYFEKRMPAFVSRVVRERD